jgi:FAD:protein FMN transferase
MQKLIPAFKQIFKPRAYQHTARFEGVLGTALELQLLVENQAIISKAENLILEEIQRLEWIYSRFLQNSELNRWQAAGCIVPSPDLAWLLLEAERWQHLSKGAFHPAVDALIAGQDSREDLQQPLWNWSGNQVQKLTPFSLNFNALAKGRIADKACAAAFQLEGVHEVLVNLGGDLCHLGAGNLEVAIAHPFSKADNAPILAKIQINNQGVATSGHTHRGAHIFDPRAAKPKPVTSIAQVTIIAPDAASADVLATICCVLEPAESLTFTESSRVGCLVVTVAGQVLTNSLFETQLKQPLEAQL